nr:tetratricopeptide repeat-containing sensor histidine kinase [uncultured Carboxylicivirga sp.]
MTNNNPWLLAFYYEYKGNINRYNKQYPTSIENFLLSIKIYTNLKDTYELTRLNFKIGAVNLDLKNYLLAEDYLRRALFFAKRANKDKLLKTTTNTLASCLQFEKKHDEALELYKYSLDSLNNTPKDSARLFLNIGGIYNTKKDYKKAEDLYLKALKIKINIKDSVGIANTYNNIAQIYLAQKKLKKASQYLDKSYQCAIKEDDKFLELNNSFNFIELYLQLNNIDSAKYFLYKYVDLKDSVSNTALKKQLNELDIKYRTLEKDNQIALLQKEDELKEARLNNQLLIIITIAGVLLLALTLGYFINRQRVKLKKSKNDLLKQQKEIETINGALKLSNQAKDRILSIIGHDLRGPIGGLKELIELYMEMPGYEEEDFRNLLKAAREASTGSYHLLENLLTWANSQRGEIDFQPVTAPLLPLIKHSIDLLDSSINTRNVSFHYEIPTTIKLTADLNMLRTIIRNLVSNAVKYSPPESCITISARQDNDETFICIADEGYGMSAEQSAVLFEKKETFYIEAGYNAKGTGLGLILCKEFVEQHNGHIWADSQPNVGTKVCFTIPVNLSAKVVKTESLVEAVKIN